MSVSSLRRVIWTERFHRASEIGSQMVTLMSRARSGSAIEKVVAVVSALGIVAKKYSGGYQRVLTSAGFLATDPSVVSMLRKAMESSGAGVIFSQVHGDNGLTIWHEAGIPIAAETAVFDTPLGWTHPAGATHLRRALWGRHSTLDIRVGKSGKYGVPSLFTAGGRPCGRWSGCPDARSAAERARSVGTGGTVSILIGGPTGSGKSTLAELICNEMEPSAKTLRISGNVLQQGQDVLLDAVGILLPDALIIDDVPMQDVQELLDLYEALRGKVAIVISTLMVDDASPSGTPLLYFPGMRPGRIDDIIWIPYPDAESRRSVLAFYGVGGHPELEEIVAATDGLTPAYLMALATRVEKLGQDCWRQEILHLRTMAPSPARS